MLTRRFYLFVFDNGGCLNTRFQNVFRPQAYASIRFLTDLTDHTQAGRLKTLL